MKKGLLLSVCMLVLTVFAFVSPASAVDMPAGYHASFADYESAMPNADVLPALNAVEETCSYCAYAASVKVDYQKPATPMTPGGASPGIVITTAYTNPTADNDPDPDIRL